MRLAFSILGEPVGKGRPKFDSRHMRTYTPKATSDYEHDVCERAAFHAIAQRWPRAFQGLVAVTIDAVFSRPLTRYRLKDPEGRMPRESGPIDADNVGKIILDGLQKGGVMRNDKQVVDLHVRLWWTAHDEAPCVEVECLTIDSTTTGRGERTLGEVERPVVVSSRVKQGGAFR